MKIVAQDKDRSIHYNVETIGILVSVNELAVIEEITGRIGGNTRARHISSEIYNTIMKSGIELPDLECDVYNKGETPGLLIKFSTEKWK